MVHANVGHTNDRPLQEAIMGELEWYLDGDARWALKALLEAAGYRVTCAAHGGEALAYLRQGRPPRAILLDLSMPVMDGWTFRKQQQRVAAWAVIPVVLLSAQNDAGVGDQIRQRGRPCSH